MNKGINLAKGTVLLFVNSGDLLTNNSLKIFMIHVFKNKKNRFHFWDCQKTLHIKNYN